MRAFHAQGVGIAISILFLIFGQNHGFASAGNETQGLSPSSLVLSAVPISPPPDSVLTSFPARLLVEVYRGGVPEAGAGVQFWMEGGTHDAAMHNAFFALTGADGKATMEIPSQNTLDQGRYLWYTSVFKPGLRGAAFTPISFTIPHPSAGHGISGGSVYTDQDEYLLNKTGSVLVRIHGNAVSYHVGDPITLLVVSPAGKTAKLVSYGAYLGAFQAEFFLESKSGPGTYSISAFHDGVEFSSTSFRAS